MGYAATAPMGLAPPTDNYIYGQFVKICRDNYILNKFVIRRIIFGIILVGIAVSAVAQMLWQPSAESDALFAAGVDLYNEGKYREAIPLFAKSDSLDKAQIDPSSNRRGYSSMWLASCYYKIGDTATAEDLDYYHYCVPPVDRRLTVASDSLRQIATEYFVTLESSKAIEQFEKVAELDKSIVGENHIWYGDNLHSISICYKDLNDTANAFKYYEKYLDIVRNSYGENSKRYVMSLADLGQLYGNFLLFDNAFDYLLTAYEKAKGLGFDKSHFAYLIADEYETASKHSDENQLDYLRKARSYVLEADSNSRAVKNLHISIERKLALCLSNAANKCYNSADYKEAIRLGTEALQIREKVLGKEHPDYAVSLNNLASYNSSLGNYSEAIRLVTEALRIEEKVLGKKHPYYATSLNNLAGYNSDLGNYPEAIRLGTEALQIREKVLGKEHPDYATSLNNLADCNSSLGNYAEAIRLGTEAVQILEKVFGKEHPSYATSLSNLAGCYSDSGNYPEAIRLGTEALRIREKVLGKEHPNYAMSLNNLASYNYYLGNYTEAIRLGTEALQTQEKTFGIEHPDYATSLSNLAGCYSDLGNYSEAIRLGTEALQIREKVLGKEHPDYAMSLNNLASYNYYLGNYTEAIRLGTEALQTQEKTFGMEHPDYATSLSNLASYNYYSGNYTEAIRLCTEALQIREKVLGKEHPDYATSLNNLADCNSSLGNYAEAIRLVTEAVQIQGKVLGKEHPSYATSLSNLAGCYSDLGNYPEAIRLGTEVLRIREKVLDKEHPDYAMSLSNLSSYNADIGNYSEAIRLGTEALYIREKVLGKEHPEYARSLNNMASYYADISNYTEAIRLGTEVLKILENVLGKEHPDYATYLENLAVYNYKAGKKSDAIKYCVEATEALAGIVQRTFADLTARERNLFWDKYKVWFEWFIHSIAYDMPSDSLTENGYNGALMAKGLLLNSEMELSALLKESGDEEVANIYNNLKNLRLQINKLYEIPVAERPLDADSLERAAQGLERQLVQRSKAYGDYTANLVIDWKQVRQRLGSGEMAVEFVSFPLRNDSIMYAAYCLREDMPSPKMVPLFEERQLRGIDRSLYLSSDALYNLVWKPLEREMEGVSTVYFAPSGELYNLPIESLPVDGNTYNSYLRSYRRLSSTRQLALRKDGVEVEKAAVYGGLKYDTDTVTLANDSRKYRTAEPVQWSSRALADSLGMRSGVSELPATKVEAEEIDKALETAQIDTKLYTDTIGTEASFKALSGSGVNALHIATHGFYWTEREATQLDGLAFLNTDMPTVVQEDKALTRSGLLFAGANTALKGLPLPDGVEDGVLTAKEIAGMDLRGLDLVALSACQTGLGEITGDGVFGLQRGFKKAGANTLLMSLWKVDDTATQLLMTQFYKNLLSGMGKYEALAAAQKYLRELEVEVKTTPDKTNYQKLKDKRDGKQEEVKYKTVRKYAHPKYWAAFVLLDGVN